MMKIIKAFFRFLFEESDRGFSKSWWNAQNYDKSGWEGPTYKGKWSR